MLEQGGDGGGGDRRLRGAKPPKAAYQALARKYNVTEGELSRALHRVKRGAGVPRNADTLVDAEGNVYTQRTGEWIGNLIDEV